MDCSHTVVAVTAHRLEDLLQALAARDVVTDQITVPHAWSLTSLSLSVEALPEPRSKQHEFSPNDPDVNTYFQEVSFSIGEAFRLLSLDERTVFLGSKSSRLSRRRHLGSVSGLKRRLVGSIKNYLSVSVKLPGLPGLSS